MSTILEHPARPGSARRALRPIGRNDQLVRAAVAAMVGASRHHGSAEAVMRANWPDDEGSPILYRAATSAASLSSAGWAAVLGSTAVADFIAGLAPVSAAASLVAGGLRIAIGRAASVRIPSVINSAAMAAFVAEGQGIPVVQAR